MEKLIFTFKIIRIFVITESKHFEWSAVALTYLVLGNNKMSYIFELAAAKIYRFTNSHKEFLKKSNLNLHSRIR